MATVTKFFMLITKNLNPNKFSVYVGKKGFTVHYANSNMSVLFKDIESYRNILGVLQIRAYGKDINLAGTNKYNQISEYLEKNCPNKRKSATKDNLLGVIGVILGVIIFFFANHGLDHDRFNFSANISLMLIILIALSIVFFVMAINPSLYEKVYKTKASNHAKNRYKFIVVSLGCLFFSYFEYKENQHMQNNQVLAKKCMQGNLEDCRLIDTYTVLSFPIKQKTKNIILEKSCEAGNKSACFISKRKPASKNNE